MDKNKKSKIKTLQIKEEHNISNIIAYLEDKGITNVKFNYDYILDKPKVIISCKLITSKTDYIGAMSKLYNNLEDIRKIKMEALILAAEDFGIHLLPINTTVKNTEKEENIYDENNNDDEENVEDNENDEYEDEENDEDTEDDESDEETTAKKKTSNGINKKQKERYKTLLAERDIKSIKRFNEILTKVREEYDIDVYKKDDLNKDNIDEVLDAIEELTEGYTF